MNNRFKIAVILEIYTTWTIVYGYSMTIGPDGKPKVREFGNVKSPFQGGGSFR
jgi:hypothetical protein